MEMVSKYGVNQFKFDGTGNVDTVFPGSRFDSDFAAAIQLIGEIRAVKPDIFINLTTGTWPSPFWLMLCGLDLARRRGRLALPASERIASDGSPIATRRRTDGIVQKARCFRSIP